VVVTHNPDIALMGDRTIEIVDGKVAKDTTMKEG